jgi:chromosome segregation ATPase
MTPEEKTNLNNKLQKYTKAQLWEDARNARVELMAAKHREEELTLQRDRALNGEQQLATEVNDLKNGIADARKQLHGAVDELSTLRKEVDTIRRLYREAQDRSDRISKSLVAQATASAVIVEVLSPNFYGVR